MKKKILLEGPFLSESGYGYQARFALNAILDRPEEFDPYVMVLPWGKTSWLNPDDPRGLEIDNLAKKTSLYLKQIQTNMFDPGFDIHLFVGIPNEVQKKSKMYNYIYTAGIETTKVSHQWLEKCNQLNGVLTVSNFSKSVFEQTKYGRKDQNGNVVSPLELSVPIKVVNYGIPNIEQKNFDLNLKAKFNFLIVAQWSTRKNMLNMIGGFLEQFKDNPDVGLVIKTSKLSNSYMDKMNVKRELEVFIKHHFGDVSCPVKLIHGNMSEGEMQTLYNHPDIKAIINIGHGEGYGLPMFEAAYSGMPVITTGWSGESDFLTIQENNKVVPHFLPVSYELGLVHKEVIWEGVILEDSMWAYANMEDYKTKLQEMLENYDSYKEKAVYLKKHLEKTHKMQDKYTEFTDFLLAPYKMSDNEVDEWLKQLEVI